MRMNFIALRGIPLKIFSNILVGTVWEVSTRQFPEAKNLLDGISLWGYEIDSIRRPL